MIHAEGKILSPILNWTDAVQMSDTIAVINSLLEEKNIE